MTESIRLVLALHNHQPMGNFGSVFEAAYRDSYAPFLDLLEDYPDLPIVLHISGSLLEWLVDARPEYIDRVRALVARRQLELLGGPFYEPILASIPRRDRIGQMRIYKRYLDQLFGTSVRGLWIPERVWEQHFVTDIADAGLEYTLLDDSHFRMAGIHDDRLHGHYLAEDSGQLIKVFAGSERLRYLIPYRDPHEVIDYCRDIAGQHPNSVLVFGDDGEKFGVWPGSHKLVFEHQWLRRFFEALRQNLSWLKVTTLAEAVDHVSPLGTVYLPDASYREMTEWALPTDRQHQLREVTQHLEQHSHWPRIKPFVRAGSWRNFLVKYPESKEMYARMQHISHKLERLSRDPAIRGHESVVNDARRELYRAQCNCPYWHGAFGGLYLPHLRHAIYRHLIAADSLLEIASRPDQHWVDAQADDWNLDARQEVCLAGERLAAFFSPATGGHLYELDVRAVRTNLLGTLNRRAEPYHETIRRHPDAPVSDGHGGGVDPNGGIAFKHAGLDRCLTYDAWPRKSLVDHFLQPGLHYDDFVQGAGLVGDFETGAYEAFLSRSHNRVATRLSRRGKIGPYDVHLTKTISLDINSPSVLEVEYQLEDLPPGLPIHFAIELNVAGMAAGASDRYLYRDDGGSLGSLDGRHQLEGVSRFGLVDEWLGLDVSFEFASPTSLWTLPIHTVSQSEGGFELVYQSTAVVPHWEFVVPAEGRWSTKFTQTCDTSAAQAKLLSESQSASRLNLVTV